MYVSFIIDDDGHGVLCGLEVTMVKVLKSKPWSLSYYLGHAALG